MPGPLSGLRIIEMAGIGPAPFAAMMLADHGAEVIRIDRPGGPDPTGDILRRSRKSIILDLKQPEAIAALIALVRTADGLIEGFRPGVMERLGLGPDELLGERPALVYGRMTGWGQEGPLAAAAGHDINYIAVSGNLHGYGRPGEAPIPPVNAVGDFGGGGMMLAFGMVSALLAVKNGAPGQVIDCAMVDGAATLAAMTWSFWQQGHWKDERGVNILDGGAPFYATYATADGKWLSVGAIEPQFHAALLEVTGLTGDPLFDQQHEQSRWPSMRARLAEVFATRTREEWVALTTGTDACLTPILSLEETTSHSHIVARQTLVEVAGVVQPAPTPRFSFTKGIAPRAAGPVGADGVDLLLESGMSMPEVERLREMGALG